MATYVLANQKVLLQVGNYDLQLTPVESNLVDRTIRKRKDLHPRVLNPHTITHFSLKLVGIEPTPPLRTERDLPNGRKLVAIHLGTAEVVVIRVLIVMTFSAYLFFKIFGEH